MAEPLKNLIGPEVRRLRDAAGLSQAKLAERCQLKGWDLSRSTLAKIEAGIRRINDGELFLLCRMLDCPMEELFRSTKPKRALEIARHSED